MATAARVLRFTVLALAVLWGMSGCSGITSAKPKAEAAVSVFHDQLNAADFDAIWNSASDKFHDNAPRPKFDKFIQAVRSKLGRVTGTSNAGWRVGNFNFKTTVVLQQKTTFEHGSGTETFTYVVHGDEVKLEGYNVQSMDLVTL
jgi:hypothetical protein